MLCGALRAACGWEAQEWAAGWLAGGGTFSRAAAVGKTWGALRALATSPQQAGNGARQAANDAVTILWAESEQTSIV